MAVKTIKVGKGGYRETLKFYPLRLVSGRIPTFVQVTIDLVKLTIVSAIVVEQYSHYRRLEGRRVCGGANTAGRRHGVVSFKPAEALLTTEHGSSVAATIFLTRREAALDRYAE
jgi:hypothetical protein